MRTLNVRLAIILLVIMVVGCAGLYFIHHIQQSRNAFFFLESSQYRQAGCGKCEKREKNRGASEGPGNAVEKLAMVSVVQAERSGRDGRIGHALCR